MFMRTVEEVFSQIISDNHGKIIFVLESSYIIKYDLIVSPKSLAPLEQSRKKHLAAY